jgi:preprotein translocase subunit SecY
MWLAEQISSRGVGNGVLLIIFAGFTAELPGTLFGFANHFWAGSGPSLAGLALLCTIVGLIPIIVLFETAERRLLVQYPKRQMTNRMFQGDASYLPLKLNTASVIPPFLASLLLLLPTALAPFTLASGPDWLYMIVTELGRGRPLYLTIYLALIIFFAFFYTAVASNPQQTADNLRKYGGFLPGIRPGARTAAYIDYVLTRITVIGAIYLAAICLPLEMLLYYLAVPFSFGPIWLLIVVRLIIGILNQIKAGMLESQYSALISKAKLRGATVRH